MLFVLCGHKCCCIIDGIIDVALVGGSVLRTAQAVSNGGVNDARQTSEFVLGLAGGGKGYNDPGARI